MMAIISDVHGNFEALRQVIESIDKMNIRKIYCLGDVVGYYSKVNECCDLLRERDVQCIMGNHDWYMVSGTVCERSRSVMDCLEYQKRIISRSNFEWIKTFPIIRIEDEVSMVHGGWNNPIDEYMDPNNDYFKKIEGKYFASGHTHVQLCQNYGDKVYCNPGAVGQPRDGDNKAGYATFDKGIFKLYRITYDYEKTIDEMKRAGFSDYYAGCLRDGSKHLHA